MSYQTGTYVKGEKARTVTSQADAVAAIFEGFKPAEAQAEEPKAEAPTGDKPSETSATPDTDAAGETPAAPARPRPPRTQN